MPLNILMIGPYSGSTGGATVLFRQLVSELRGRADAAVDVIDTSHSSCELLRLPSVTARLVWRVWHSDVISLHVSSMQAALYAVVIWIVCAIAGRPWMLRIFGDASVKHRNMPASRRAIFDWILRRCPLFMVETRRAEQYFRQRCGAVRWHPNSRPLSVRSSQHDVVAGARRFVFVGHVKPSKGVREILEAGPLLEGGATVDVFGELRDGIRAEEFGDTVRYCGELAPEEVSPTLANYDVLLLPTYYGGEGYPGVILEAFAAGLPVIATRWQAIPEIVGGENGILVEPRDAKQLASAMRFLGSDSVEFQKRRAGALQSARWFDSALWTERFLQSIDGLVHSRQAPIGSFQSLFKG